MGGLVVDLYTYLELKCLLGKINVVTSHNWIIYFILVFIYMQQAKTFTEMYILKLIKNTLIFGCKERLIIDFMKVIRNMCFLPWVPQICRLMTFFIHAIWIFCPGRKIWDETEIEITSMKMCDHFFDRFYFWIRSLFS